MALERNDHVMVGFIRCWNVDRNCCLHVIGLDTGSLHLGFLCDTGVISR